MTLNGEKAVNFVKHSIRTDSTDKYTFSAGLIYSFVGGGPTIKYAIAQNCVFHTVLVCIKCGGVYRKDGYKIDKIRFIW